MLLTLIIVFSIQFSIGVENEKTNVRKPYAIIPVPLDLPNRNDHAEQCWLRIEDIELTETLAVYCHIAQAFLLYFIQEYNTRKMLEDKIDVSLWNEEPRPVENIPVPRIDADVKATDNQNSFVDWKQTTIKDPTTRRRLYVTKKADCRLIMYSRDGMTNYEVDCGTILYFINVRMNSCAVYKGDMNIFMVTLFVIVFNRL